MSTPSLVLGLDSSTEWLSVALQLGDGSVLQRTEEGGARASQRMLPLLAELLEQAGLSLQQVGLIGFGAGPGAFTGVRAACAAAQGLGHGLACPVVPVPTLLAVAAGCDDQPEVSRWLVVNDARMGEVYWALAECEAAPARPGETGWRLAEAPRVESPRQAAQHWLRRFGDDAAALALCGNAWDEHGEALAQELGAGWQAALQRARRAAPQAAAVARLARREHAAGASMPALQARPLYVRDKVALTTAERAQHARSLPAGQRR